MADLPDDIFERVKDLCAEGDGLTESEDYDDALEAYFEALELLPEPKTRWNAAAPVLTSIADVYFLAGEDADAVAMLELALKCPGADANAFLHLRLGQSLFELGDKDRAAAELDRAYKTGGADLFDDEDPRYLAFLMTRVEAPPDGW